VSSTSSEEVTARERRMREVDFEVGINNHIVRVGRLGWPKAKALGYPIGG
jgi:hypothetical protein